MAQEIYLYTSIYDFVAESISQQIEASKGEPVTMRLNSPGGNVFSGWAIAGKMMEHGNVSISVDGACMSMAVSLLPFAKHVTASDVSVFMMHQASTYAPTEDEKAVLAKMNKDILAKFKSKIDSKQFKEITGMSLDDLYLGEERKDLFITAKQAKDLGLVDKIVKMNPKDIQAFNDKIFAAAAVHKNGTDPEDKPKHPETKIIQKMNLDKLKAEHPEVYAEAFKAGQKFEADRVGAWMAFMKFDPEAVKAGIKGTELPSETDKAEFQAKAFSLNNINQLENGGKKPIAPDAAAELTEKEKALAEFEATVDKNLGINQSNKA